jgi:outer membrane protein TolC
MKNLILKAVLLMVICFNLSTLKAQKSASQLKPAAEYQSEILKVTHILDDHHILDSIVEKAYLNAPVVRAFDQEMELYDEEYLQKKRDWVSSFRLGVNIFSATTDVTSESQSVTSLGILPNLGLNLSIDPAKLVNRKSSMRQAEDKKMRSYYLQQDQKQVLKSKIVSLYYEYLSSLEASVIRQQSLDTRKQYHDVFEVEFRNGNKTYDELLSIQHQVYLAEESLMRGHIQSMKMKSQIEIYLGIK